MTYQVSLSPRAKKQLLHLDRPVRESVKSCIDGLELLEDPRSKGHALTGPLSGLWRYRVGDIRLLCRIEDSRVLIFVVEIGNRKDIYK